MARITFKESAWESSFDMIDFWQLLGFLIPKAGATNRGWDEGEFQTAKAIHGKQKTPVMTSLVFFGPEVLISLGGLLLLGLDMAKDLRRSLGAAVAYAATAGAIALLAVAPHAESGMSEFFSYEGLTVGFSLLILFGLTITVALSQEDETLKNHWGTYLALLLFATAGCLLLVKSRDFLYAFVSIELVSISSFILVAFERREMAMIEGALKYFLVGAFSAAIALYGISLYYSATGGTGFAALGRLDWAVSGEISLAPLALAGLLLALVSFGFKASIVPFHFWVPDAYQSAPTPITAYLSVVPKLASLAVLATLASTAWDGAQSLSRMAELKMVFAVLAVLTMTVGNLSAIHQTDLKRLLAYSSIAQAGYMMIGIVAATALGSAAILFYGFAYLFMNFGAFACVFWAAKRAGSYDLGSCDGLAARHLPFALTFTVFLLSLAGLPPMVGFVAKYLIFAGALAVHWAWWVALIGALNSVIGVYYYLRIVYRMFFIETAPSGRVFNAPILAMTILVLVLGTLVLGFYPKPLLALARF